MIKPGSIDLTQDPSIRRILIMKWSAMGDVTLASAAIEDIHQAFPNARLVLDTLPPWDQLYANDPRFDRIQAYPLRAKGLIKRLRASWGWLRAVSRRRYDLVVDLQTTDRSRAMIGALGLLGAAIRHRAGNKPAWPYNLAGPHIEGARHALDLARSNLSSFGVHRRTNHPVLHFTIAQREHAEALVDEYELRDKIFAIFLPGCQAAGYLKRWGAPRYAELARQLLVQDVSRIVILGGPDEMDECANITALVGDDRIINLAGVTDLADVPLIANHATFIVGNDTGTAHLAAAAKKRMVIVCGATDPRRVKPAGDEVRTVQLDIPCRNCYAKHCSHQSCMVLLKPSLVISELL
ncbi:MAG: ADP-heptose:LPS heptosyltransferase [Limisphaerales bacterium]|jgi:ADP-heptose:LPS heptosyltransferase